MITETLTRLASRQSLTLRKHGPSIGFAAGIGGVLIGTYLACRATLRLETTLDEITEEIDGVKQREQSEDYSENDKNKDLAYVYAKSTLRLGRLYGPAIGVQAVSIGLLTGSHVTLKRRNTNLMLAYSALEAAYSRYRASVEDRDRERMEELESRDDRLSKALAENERLSMAKWSAEFSPYARIFDETTYNFERNAELNRIFIEATQAWANNRLTSQGYLFLNDVYRALGLEETGAGQVVGWVLKEGNQNCVDLGLWRAHNSRFINLLENAVVLDFNVDGVVFDQIDSWRARRVGTRPYYGTR